MIPAPGPLPPQPNTDPRADAKGRAVALLEVLICSDFPTQLALGSTFSALGFQPFDASGRMQITYVVGLSLADGSLLWQIPFTTEYDQNAVTPVVVRDLLIFSGIGKPLVAHRIARAGVKWTTTPVWQNESMPMYMSSPVSSGDQLYGLTQRNRGQFFCVDAASGKTLWTSRGREGENAALTLAGDLLLTTTTEGELVVMRANPKAFEIVKRYTVAESAIWAHPGVTTTGVLVKDAESLTYWTF